MPAGQQTLPLVIRLVNKIDSVEAIWVLLLDGIKFITKKNIGGGDVGED